MSGSRAAARIKSNKVPVCTGIILAVVLILCAAVPDDFWNRYTAAGACFWAAVVMAVYIFRPGSWLNSFAVSEEHSWKKLITAVSAAALILVCVLPMSLSPAWNGQAPKHRNEYEVMTESLLEGHLYLDYDDIDPKLLTMDNPYDPEERQKLHVSVHWDHAWYNGHYYMYFGIVPVIITFLPYRLITGHELTTYHATQLYVMLLILGFFILFRELSDRFYRKLPFGAYLALSLSAGAISSWYCAEAPALYCTAISAGLFLEVWSLYFFVHAVFGMKEGKKRVACASFGALLGALAFGCRPPVALGNLVALGLIVPYVKGRRPSKKLFGELFAIVLPYILVAAALMWYNYARFDNPFEFGQSYQLTVADQHTYSNPLSNFNGMDTILTILGNFFEVSGGISVFPYIGFNGAFINFPLFFLIFILLRKEVRSDVKENGLRGFVIGTALTPILVTVLDVLYSPYLIERYRLDIYYLLSILTFVTVASGFKVLTGRERKRLAWAVCLLSVLALVGSFLLFLVPNDSSITDLYPGLSDIFRRIILFF